MPRATTTLELNEPVSVFISIGNQYRPEQARFLDALVETLAEFGVRPRVIERTDYPTSQPLRFISNILRECRGTVIVAFERCYFPSGRDKPGSPSEAKLSETRVTTPWNQIEAAMAYQLGLPLLVLAEEGLRLEGLIEGNHDWYVERIRVDAAVLAERPLRARLQGWCKSVSSGSVPAPLSAPLDDKLAVGELIKLLPVSAAVKIVAFGGALFTAGMAAGAFLKSTTLIGK